MAVNQSNLKIVIAGEFVKKGFNQADTAVNKLTRSTKRLAGTLGLAFGTAAILGYAKASVKAAAADIKAQKQLTLALNNLGMARDAAGAERYIQSLQSEFGIVDDLLRPAYAQLARATLSATKAQDLLQLGLDISASTGKDLGSVVSALSKAYLGSNTALSKLGTNLTKADLTTKSFEENAKTLAATFKGSAKASADTFAGSMDKLGVASANVKEIIGTGIIDALKGLGDDKSIDKVTTKMEGLALSIADTIRGVGLLLGKLETEPKPKGLWQMILRTFGDVWAEGPMGQLERLGRSGGTTGKPRGQFTKGGGGTLNVGPNLLVKAEKERLALLKKQLEAEKKKAALEKAKLSLSKASAAFDLAKISIAAALKGKIDEETKLRLLAMQAIENDQGELALKYIGQLAALQKSADLEKLAGITTIGDAQLHALNTQLLKELDGIDKSKMAQGEKDRLIQIAFGKYNSALTVAGGLADANSYSEATQISNNKVLKIASINAGTNTMLAATMLLESAQNDSIKRVQSAQKLADNERMAALLAYMAAINSIAGGTFKGPTPAPRLPFPTTPFPDISATPEEAFRERGGFQRGEQGSITININPGLITDPAGVAQVVAEAVQSAQRNGYSLGTAGMIAV